MSTKTEQYRQALQALQEWDDFLLAQSGLPGPRGNLELAHVVAEMGDEARFRRYFALGPEEAPTNSPQEFLTFCGVLGLGRLLAAGREDVLAELRRFAADPRWRTREAVAMALQTAGAADMDHLLQIASSWSQGSHWEQRAAVAAVCEPALLVDENHAGQVLDILNAVTARLLRAPDRRDPGFKTLRQALGYCWSVAVVALPEKGKQLFETWLENDDPDVRWLVRENLRKKRLQRMDAPWVAGCRRRAGLQPVESA